MTLVELNYNIYNKELLGMVTIFKEQRAFLYSTIKLFKIVINYKNLIEFLIIKKLNRKQVKWVKKLIEYYFKIKYIRGTKNAKVNILSKKVEL